MKHFTKKFTNNIDTYCGVTFQKWLRKGENWDWKFAIFCSYSPGQIQTIFKYWFGSALVVQIWCYCKNNFKSWNDVDIERFDYQTDKISKLNNSQNQTWNRLRLPHMTRQILFHYSNFGKKIVKNFQKQTYNVNKRWQHVHTDYCLKNLSHQIGIFFYFSLFDISCQENFTFHSLISWENNTGVIFSRNFQSSCPVHFHYSPWRTMWLWKNSRSETIELIIYECQQFKE